MQIFEILALLMLLNLNINFLEKLNARKILNISNFNELKIENDQLN